MDLRPKPGYVPLQLGPQITNLPLQLGPQITNLPTSTFRPQIGNLRLNSGYVPLQLRPQIGNLRLNLGNISLGGEVFIDTLQPTQPLFHSGHRHPLMRPL